MSTGMCGGGRDLLGHGWGRDKQCGSVSRDYKAGGFRANAAVPIR